MTSSGIEVRGVWRSFGNVHAVRNAEFVASSGAVTALIGPNGSGKTTLMLMLATLLRPDAGTIRVAGHDPLVDPQAVRRAMGWMPDLLGSWASLSVRSTLEYTGRLYGFDRALAAYRAQQLIELIGLGELARQPTRVLSRGQKQKLSLARSLVHDPQVLLLDEPASGLDPSARVELRMLVKRLAAEGRTILISSHELAELDELADTAVYLSAGSTVSEERVAQASTGVRAWRVRALDALALPPALSRAGVHPDRVSVDSLGILVAVDSDRDAAALLTALVSAGLAITSFAPAVGRLEHTFLDLQGDSAGGAAGGTADGTAVGAAGGAAGGSAGGAPGGTDPASRAVPAAGEAL